MFLCDVGAEYLVKEKKGKGMLKLYKLKKTERVSIHPLLADKTTRVKDVASFTLVQLVVL